MTFPAQRPRRLRRSAAFRRLVAETRLSVDDLVAPLFVREGIDEPQPIASLPGVVQHTRESLRKEVAELADLGVPAVILFGVPARKDADRAARPGTPTASCRSRCATCADEVGDRLVLMADCCLDEYTDHGHCGVLTPARRRRQRRHHRAVRPRRGGPGRCRRPRRRPERDDGRPGRRHPRRPRRQRPPRHRHPRLLGQVRVRPVRPVPRRRRRPDRRWRRPQGLPAGLAQRARGPRRGAGRPRPGRRHGDGEAGARLPRRHRRGAGRRRRAGGRLPRVAASTR